MLDKLKSFFELNQDDGALASEEQLRLACAALMIEVATVDSHFDDEELGVLQTELKKQFGLSASECEELTNAAALERNDATSLHQFTRLVHEQCDPQTKYQLVRSMWQVAMADGLIDKYEEHLIRRAADLLYLSHSDFIRAKHEAKDKT